MSNENEYVYSFGATDVHRIVYSPVQSNMYALFEHKEMLLVDPNRNVGWFLKKYDVDKVIVLLTHEDYDHTNGIPYISDEYAKTIICHKQCEEKVSNPRNNRPLLVLQVLAEKFGKDSNEVQEEKEAFTPYAVNADVTFCQIYEFDFQKHKIRIVYTPGHTIGSCCIEIDGWLIFTGDTLLMDNSSIMRFRGSSKEIYNEYTKPYIEGIPNGTMIFPGHGEPFLVDTFRTSNLERKKTDGF